MGVGLILSSSCTYITTLTPKDLQHWSRRKQADRVGLRHCLNTNKRNGQDLSRPTDREGGAARGLTCLTVVFKDVWPRKRSSKAGNGKKVTATNFYVTPFDLRIQP